jgi:hypothetical protein
VNKQLIIGIFILLIVAPCVLSAEKLVNKTISKEAIEMQSVLNQSEKEMAELIEKGLTVVRYNDTLGIAQQTYEAQLALEQAGGKTDFSIVFQKINELKSIKKNALVTFDELRALELTVNQTSGIDMQPVLDIYNQAKEAFDSERYEESKELIDKTYEKISEMEAFDTKLKAFSDAVSKSVIGFIKEHWKIITVIVIALAIIITLTYEKVMIDITRNRIKGLEIRKQSIQNLIAQTQKDYFETGKVSESTYKTRTAKYAEFIRDINRQIPLLKEELEMREQRLKKKQKQS